MSSLWAAQMMGRAHVCEGSIESIVFCTLLHVTLSGFAERVPLSGAHPSSIKQPEFGWPAGDGPFSYLDENG